MNANVAKQPQTRYLFIIKYVIGASDVLLMNLAFIASALIAYGFSTSGSPPQDQQVFQQETLVVINLVWLLLASIFGLYRNDTITSLEDIYRSSWRTGLFHLIICCSYFSFSKQIDVSPYHLLIFYTFFGGLIILSRFTGTYFQFTLDKHFRIRERVSIMGNDSNTSKRLASYFEQHQLNYKLENLPIKDEMFIDGQGKLQIATVGKHFMKAAVAGVREIYLSLKPQYLSHATALAEEADKHCLRLNFVPDLSDGFDSSYHVQYLNAFPVLTVRKEPMSEISNRFKKRIFDLSFSILVVVFILSWLYPIIAILIKMQSPGPVLFKQLRSGRNNESFYCYKFRSMRVNSDSDRKQASKDDDRITPIGRFLRKTSLDELPQFINVLKGEMSVIGPRPHMLAHTEEYSTIIKKYMVRHFVKPGITGWAQANGYRGETKDSTLMEKRVEHDVWYLENWTAMLDVRIVFLTIINMVKGEENAH
ncbi:exopolysaccharide biosynthesis polyprenyl glycosylphosphotransferase [Parapedobacter tibetensis]|uniref:exopolysaccharide biosynthesis polyprenyl glycosylphosphotransferase n=1 Tax=Parapedobacter tibetensis TaxID=2972951 RepID=UPI00214D7054|nr:exopolysaccharide biosynthesis polyprenyl glycosylphosphotransferase [Parapedobacter tibetensis]